MPAGLAAGGNPDCDLTRSRTAGPGGARRSRTDDILLAKQALYQLSYGPVSGTDEPRRAVGDLSVKPAGLVGTGRLELPTLRLSGVRSNHLSYAPMAATARPPSRREGQPRLAIARSTTTTRTVDAAKREIGKRNEDGGAPQFMRSLNRPS